MKRSAPLKRSKPKRWRPSFTGLAFWMQLKAELAERSGGRCEWQDDLGLMAGYERCRKPATDAAHIRALKMGGSRFDPSNPRNVLTNLLHLCRLHHETQERQRRCPWRGE